MLRWLTLRGLVIGVILSALVNAALTGRYHQTISAGQYHRHITGRRNFHRLIDALFRLAIGEQNHCREGFTAWLRIERARLGNADQKAMTPQANVTSDNHALVLPGEPT